MIRHYLPGEFQVTLVRKDGTREAVNVTALIDLKTIILYVINNKLYVVNSADSSSVYSNNCIDTVNNQIMHEYFDSRISAIGNVDDLTCKAENLVEAINYLSKIIQSPRCLVGLINWLVFTEDSFKYIEPNDLDICYRYDTKKFYYYSDATKEWIELPESWAKCDKLVRKVDEALNCKGYIGCLEDVKIYHDGYPIELRDKIGDEYIVRGIVEPSGHIVSGSLIRLPQGFRYLI